MKNFLGMLAALALALAGLTLVLWLAAGLAVASKGLGGALAWVVVFGVVVLIAGGIWPKGPHPK